MNHDLKIFPGDAHVLGLNSSCFIGFVGQSEAILEPRIEWSVVVNGPLLDIFLARQHQFRTTTLEQMTELGSCFLDPRRPNSISPRRGHEAVQEGVIEGGLGGHLDAQLKSAHFRGHVR